MTQRPPPQYILPPASLPLVPVRPSAPPSDAGGGGGVMRSSRASSNSANENEGRNNCSDGRNNANSSTNGSEGNYLRRDSSSHATVGNNSSVTNEPRSVCSDAENIMSRGNGGPSSQQNGNQPRRRSLDDALKKEPSQRLIGNDNSNAGDSNGETIEGGKEAAMNEAPVPIKKDSAIPTTAPSTPGDTAESPVLLPESTTAESLDFPSVALDPSPGNTESGETGEAAEDGAEALDTSTLSASDIRIGRTGNPVGSMGLLLDSAEKCIHDMMEPPEEDQVGNAQAEEGIRIGNTGNPVGSMGYLLDTTEEYVHDMMEPAEEETALSLDRVVNDDQSDPDTDTSDSNVTHHFPLEISTDDGGVSALLPSGQVLVDPGPTVQRNANRAKDELRGSVADKLSQILGEKEREAVVKGSKSSDANSLGDNSLEEEEEEVVEKRSSGTPEHASSPSESPREEPVMVEQHHLHEAQVQPPRRDVPGMEPMVERHHLHETQVQPPRRDSGGLLSQAGELDSSQPQSLLQAQTNSSSISEDPTFNSYAPSELSSMMSHLEIQALLKQGRQQVHDIEHMRMDGTNKIQRLSDGPPAEISGKGAGGRNRPMALYSNQSMMYNAPTTTGVRTGERPVVFRTRSPPNLVARGVTHPSMTRGEFPDVQSTPSSSSHCLLQRADAMEDSSLSNKVPDAPLLYGGLGMPPPMPGHDPNQYQDAPYQIPHFQSGESQKHQHQYQRQDTPYQIPHLQNEQYQGRQHQPQYQRQDTPQYSQQEDQQYYPHLLVQNSTITSMPSFGNTTITTMQDDTPSLYHANPLRCETPAASTVNTTPMLYQANPLRCETPASTLAPSVPGLYHAAPIECETPASIMAPGRNARQDGSDPRTDITPSVVTERTPEGVDRVRVEVEVVRSPNASPKASRARSPMTSASNSGDVLDKVSPGSNVTDEHTAASATSRASQGRASIAEERSTFSHKTASTEGRKSVQSLLGTSTKSLADDLCESESPESEEGERGIPKADNNGGAQSNDAAAAARLNWQKDIHPQPLAIPRQMMPRDDSDGYSADRSNFELGANDISEYSTSANSYAMELRQGLPMNPSEETDVNSHLHNGYGYGHVYAQEPVPTAAIYTEKPNIPPTFPSLMDSSISSAFTQSTAAASRASRAPSVAVVSVSGRSGMSGKRQTEGEEREDSLPRISNAVDPSRLPARRDLQGLANSATRDGIVSGTRSDPLMATSAAMPMTNSNNVHQQPPVVMMHHHPLPVDQHQPPPPPSMNDPRMAIDYERRYIVDLEQIAEESSENQTNLSSAGGRNKFSGSASSSPRPMGSPRRLGSPRPSGEFDAIPEGYGQGQLQQQPMLAQNQNGQMTAQSQNYGANPAAASNFYDYRHQYYTEQYHYCDDRFSQASNNHHDRSHDDCDETNSTCSSVTLSQAFHPDDVESCASSSYTEDYSESHTSPSVVSTVSSVTLSRALSADKHEHSQGFYVATRLGDYVEVPKDDNPPPPPPLPTMIAQSAGTMVMESAGVFAAAYDEELEREEELAQRAFGSSEGTKSDNVGTSDDTTNGGDSSTMRSDEVDAVSDATADAVDVIGNNAGVKNATQLTSTSEGVESDIISALVPECGVPIPSVMARVAQHQQSRSGRVPSGKGGMLLPWHSTRSIQNYQHNSRKGGGRRSNSDRSRGGSGASIFSISSVHTFRG